MTLTDTDTMLAEFGFECTTRETYLREYRYRSGIFHNGIALCVVVMGEEGRTENGFWCRKEMTEDHASFRFFLLNKQNEYGMFHYCGQVLFQDKNLSELTPDWLKRYLEVTVGAIKALEKYNEFCDKSEEEARASN